MSELSYYKIDSFDFIFSNYDIDDSIFNVFHIDSDLVEEQCEDDFRCIYLKKKILKARRRFNLKCHISRKEIEELFKNSVSDCYRITSYFEENNYSDRDIERLLKKEFSFDKYIIALKELFVLANSKEFKTYLEKSRMKNDFIKIMET